MNPSTKQHNTNGKGLPPVRIPRRETVAAKKKRAESIVKTLALAFPAATCSLNFRNPFELIISTILSAQCTDKRVNMVTPTLFRRWPTPEKMAKATQTQIETVIRTTGFFRSKAKNILGCSRALVERHSGEVPQQLSELVALPGVGRKTANVVLGSGFGQAEGVVVDTHVGRISRRLGLTKHVDAVQAERDLMKILPADDWIQFSHFLIELGRSLCSARSPTCQTCMLLDLCPRSGVIKKHPLKR